MGSWSARYGQGVVGMAARVAGDRGEYAHTYQRAGLLRPPSVITTKGGEYFRMGPSQSAQSGGHGVLARRDGIHCGYVCERAGRRRQAGTHREGWGMSGLWEGFSPTTVAPMPGNGATAGWIGHKKRGPVGPLGWFTCLFLSWRRYPVRCHTDCARVFYYGGSPVQHARRLRLGGGSLSRGADARHRVGLPPHRERAYNRNP